MIRRSEKGFTLIELLIVIALVAIVAGVSADIVLSIVRSYTKTRTQTEVEQSANFALLKLEKELKSATSLNSPASGSAEAVTFHRSINGQEKEVTYTVLGTGTLERTEVDVVSNSTTTAPLLNAADPEGIIVTSTPGDTFTVLHDDPYVIQIQMTLEPASTAGGTSFAGNVIINQTVVLRGTYR